MSDNALEAQGTVIKIKFNPDESGSTSSTSSEEFVVIPEVSNFNLRTGSAAVKDVSDLLSTRKEKRTGLPDEGQLTFTLNFLPKEPTHIELESARGDRQKRMFQIVMTDDGDGGEPTTYQFEGYVITLPIAGGVDESITSNAAIEITGEVERV